MPFPSAISDYTPLRGSASVTPSYAASQLLCLCPNTVIFEALVDITPSGSSFAQIQYDTVTTGAYTDIEEGMTVLIGTSSTKRKAQFVGRIRADNSNVVSTSGYININETSVQITAGDHIWVLNDYRVWDKLARLLNGTQYKDYSKQFSQLKPVIYGLQSAYAGVCSGSPSGFTVAFAASAFAGTSGATISSYAWTIPSGGTVTAGATNTANVTVRFDAGFYWLKLVVTDSGGRTATRRIPVWSIPADYSSVVTLGFEGASIQGDEGSWSATVNAFYGVDTLLDNTLACIVNVEYYNGSATSIVSAVEFVGRLRTENTNTDPDPTYSQIPKASYEIEGVGGQLSREEHLPFTLVTKTSPTIWDEIKTLTLWRAIVYTLQEHTTFLSLHSLTFDSTADTFAYPALPTQGGNMLAVINDLAVSINAVFQHAPTGECQVVRNANYLTTAQRNALTTIANFTTADLINFSVATEEVDTTGKIDASGGFYNSTSGKVTPLLSLAPGMAQGVGETISSLTRQILAADATQPSAQNELNIRCGHHYEATRRKPVELTVNMPPGYHWIVPSFNQWYTWTIASTDNAGGRAYTTSDRWLCVSVDVSHDNASGSKSVQAVFRLETAGQAGQTVVYPPPASIATSIPTIPVIPPYASLPPLPSISLPTDPTDSDTPPYTPPKLIANGNIAVVWTSAQGWVTQNLLTTVTPTWFEVTPPNALETALTFQWEGNGSRGLYALSNDGTDSRFHYTADAFENPPTWVDTDLTGIVYTTIRVFGTSGAVEVIGSLTDTAPGLASWSIYSPSHGSNLTTGSDGTGDYVQIDAVETVPGTWYAIIVTGGDSICCDWFETKDGSGNPLSVTRYHNACGEAVDTATPHPYIGSTNVRMCEAIKDSAFTIRFYFRDCSATTFTTKVAYSDDFGATFASPQSISGGLSSNIGCDVEKIGLPTLAGVVGQVKIATTAGGAFSDYGDPFPTDAAPNAIWTPRYTFAGANNTATSTPQYVAASAALTGSNTSIWRVTSSGTVFTSITPSVSGDYGTIVGVDALAMPFKSGSRITAVFDFAGTRKLLTSVNSGTSWSNRGNVDALAAYVRYRRGDLSMKQLFIANGDSGIKISTDHGATLKSRTAPTTDTILGIEPL